MNILHVTLGNPDTHQGGLNLYCSELIKVQIYLGHKVAVLYPGTFYKSRNPYVYKRIHADKLIRYEIIDALPVAITYGIDNPQRYMVPVSQKTYINLLKNFRPNIIHVHSVQGIHKEFFDAANELKIPIVYTTHDYYLICRKSVLLNEENCLCMYQSDEECAKCNSQKGLRENIQRVIQSNIYQYLKNTNILKHLKKKNHKYEEIKNDIKKQIISYDVIDDFSKLNLYYRQIVDKFNLIHCNSQSTQKQYSDTFPYIKSEVIPITHGGLKIQSHLRNSICKIVYMGGTSEHKGYKFFLNAIELLINSDTKKEWNAALYGGEFQNHELLDKRVCYKGYFTSNEKDEVWNQTDILVVPSLCRETFGFVVLEALCNRIPVICSDLVGAKDLVPEELVYEAKNVNQLFEKIVWLLNEENYAYEQHKIGQKKICNDMIEHTEKIQEMYKEIIEKNNDI